MSKITKIASQGARTIGHRPVEQITGEARAWLYAMMAPTPAAAQLAAKVSTP